MKMFRGASGAMQHWLCIQDDADEDADGKLVRITGWMGCKTLDSDLYGDSGRWEPMG